MYGLSPLHLVQYKYYCVLVGSNRIWDRGALVAIRPEDREEYSLLCDSLLEPGGLILLVTLVYDQDKMKGEEELAGQGANV